MFTPARCTCTAYAVYHSVRPVVDEQKTVLAAAKAMTRGAVPFNRACVKECALMCNSLDVISEDPAPSRGGEGEQGTQTLESQIATDSPCTCVAVSTQTKKEPVLVPLARETRSARWQQTTLCADRHKWLKLAPGGSRGGRARGESRWEKAMTPEGGEAHGRQERDPRVSTGSGHSDYALRAEFM